METNNDKEDFFDDVNINKSYENNSKEIQINNKNDNKINDIQSKEKLINEEELNEELEEVSLENIDEDLYMQELYLRLSQMKKERKQAEENANLLNNRLNLLKGEESKALKQIELTKKKANDKYQNLQFLLKNNNIKNEAKQNKEKDLILKKQQNKLMNQKIKNNTAMNKEKLKRQIEEEAKLLKIQKIYNKQLINFLNEEKINENKIKCDKIKNEINNFNEKKRMNNNKKKIKLREELEKKLIEEYKLKEEAENKKMKAEQQEIEIIKKLQTTTKLQQSMTDELKKMNIKSIMNGDYENYNISNQNNFKGKNKKPKTVK
jgi:hypothetical protein